MFEIILLLPYNKIILFNNKKQLKNERIIIKEIPYKIEYEILNINKLWWQFFCSKKIVVARTLINNMQERELSKKKIRINE